MITLKEAKNYLRVDYDEDDKLIQKLLSTSKQLVMDVGSVVEGSEAVKIGLIDELGGISDAIQCLSDMIECSEKRYT